ncbi:MAG: Flagellar hook-basal body complex protein FliE [Pseudomonadota bacterium]|jgi:flagellar hook-basal body complex protein FliE
MIEKTAATATGVADMMAQIRAYQAKVQGAAPQVSAPQVSTPLQGIPPSTPPVGKPSFGEVVSGSLSKVNDLQSQSSRMREAYEKGENVPLTDVVLSMQKSSLAFEATLQIRNKIMKAYEDVLNMPV